MIKVHPTLIEFEHFLMSTESILGSNYDSKTDIYSFGFLALKMLTKEILFENVMVFSKF
jgi:serine/threonine protein kinase